MLQHLADGDAHHWCVAFSGDRRHMASGAADRLVRVWKFGTGQPQILLEGNADTVSAVAFSPQGTLLSAGHDDQVRLWQLERPVLVGELPGRPVPGLRTTQVAAESRLGSPHAGRQVKGPLSK